MVSVALALLPCRSSPVVTAKVALSGGRMAPGVTAPELRSVKVGPPAEAKGALTAGEATSATPPHPPLKGEPPIVPKHGPSALGSIGAAIVPIALPLPSLRPQTAPSSSPFGPKKPPLREPVAL